MYKYGTGHVYPRFRTHPHRMLPYVNEPFNNPDDLKDWEELGYTHTQFTGDLYDMRHNAPPFLDLSVFQKELQWEELSWAYYKMTTGTILPEHVDTFKRFKELHPDHPGTIMRAVVFLEDWYPGHVFTIADEQIHQWRAGDYIWWEHDVPHLAANIGIEDRYTLQLTGFKL